MAKKSAVLRDEKRRKMNEKYNISIFEESSFNVGA